MVQMGDVLHYTWEIYCGPNVGFVFLRVFEDRKVQRYKWGAYCNTNWRCTLAECNIASSRRTLTPLPHESVVVRS